MDLFDVVRSCFRRWYVLLPLLIATGFITYHYYSAKGKPLYYANTVVGLAAPNSMTGYYPGQPVPRNGLLEVGGPTVIMNMAVIAYNDPAVKAKVLASGGKNFSARMFRFSASAGAPGQELPMIMIDTIQDDSQAAIKTVQLARDEAEPILHDLQQRAGVPENLMAHALMTGPPSVSGAVTESRTKASLAIAGVGASIAVFITVVLDIVLLRRRANRLGLSPSGRFPTTRAGGDGPNSQRSEMQGQLENADTV